MRLKLVASSIVLGKTFDYESAISGFWLQNRNKTAFQKTLTRFWTVNSVKYENVIIGAHHVRLGTPERETKVGKQGVRSLYLFEITKYKINSYLNDLISFTVICRFIGLRHKIT